MTFLYGAALAAVLLVVAPLIAHLLQRRRADERDFPPARLVPASPPVARRRRRVDDRALYAVRTAAVVGLVLLGASPFVHCSSLALGRQAGASIALAVVLDDSLSMLAETGGSTRWARAMKAADDLLSSARSGDAVGIVLAGAPPRIALASTTDLAAARSVLATLRPTHRGTDLEGALDLARSLVHGLPQVDQRVVLLSDLADGHPEGPALGAGGDIPLWVPPAGLTDAAENCAVLRADRQRDRATVRVACSPAAASRGRSVQVVAGDKVIAEKKLPDQAASTDVGVDLGAGAPELTARLTGRDAIAADDAAPVLSTTGQLAVAIVADPASSKLVTGGAPPVEQALSALELGVEVRPLPLVPDRADDLATYAGVILEDPAGFTPEARRSLGAWLERGGVALLALGPHAPLAPLGASFEPLVTGAVTWGPSAVEGVEAGAASLFGSAGAGLLDLRARGRAKLDVASLGGAAKVVARWKDGAPWLIERSFGRGFAFILTLPTSAEQSDLALRPAFLVLLEKFADAARVRNGAHRTPVGEPWTFEGAKSLEVLGPGRTPLHLVEEATAKIVVPDKIGVYDISLDGDKLTRVAAPVEREVDLRPRDVAPAARSSSLGDVRAKLDLSPYLAVALLALLVAELTLRAIAARSGAHPASVSLASAGARTEDAPANVDPSPNAEGKGGRSARKAS
jgi:hypothetical protein